MTKLLEQAIREVGELPATEQDAAAGALLDYLAHRKDTRLTDEQLDEIRRRRADPERTLLSYDEVQKRIHRLGSLS